MLKFLRAQAEPVLVVGGSACGSHRRPILWPGSPWDPMMVFVRFGRPDSVRRRKVVLTGMRGTDGG